MIAVLLLCVLLLPVSVSAGSGGAPSITAKYAVLVDADTDTILYRKNMNDRIRPASLTKMMTLLVSFEQNKQRLNAFITVTAEMIDVPAGSSSANLCDGDMISIHDLFYAMMLPSGNDAAKVLAYVTSGSETASHLGSFSIVNTKCHIPSSGLFSSSVPDSTNLPSLMIHFSSPPTVTP